MDEGMRARKVYTPFQMGSKGREWLDQLAYENHTTRSEVIRTALHVARKHEAEVKQMLRERG